MATQHIDKVFMDDVTPVAGVRFRHFVGEGDFAAMADVVNASKIPDGIERTLSAAELAHKYAHLPNCDPYQDLTVAEAANGMVGYGAAMWWQDQTGTRVYGHWGFLKPPWRRKRIGTTMLHWMQARLRAIAASHPNDEERYFQAFVSDTEAGTQALLRHDGYAPVRYTYNMVRPTLGDLSRAPLPAGLEVRPVEPEHYRAIWDADAEAFQDHWGYSLPSEEDYQRWINDPVIFTPHLWRVAWDTEMNQVVGQVRSFINGAENAEYKRKRGYAQVISVRRLWRKRGLAHALIVQSLALLKEQGMTEAALGVDTENISGALRVYESVGFEPVKRSTIYRKPL